MNALRASPFFPAFSVQRVPFSVVVIVGSSRNAREVGSTLNGQR
jgi:hypothetical protein